MNVKGDVDYKYVLMMMSVILEVTKTSTVIFGCKLCSMHASYDHHSIG